jgi:DNA-directed RNA polymerase I, II, and III subunit RPABC2
MVVSTDYFPGKEQQPIYKIKDKNEEGKYLIEQWNVNEGETVSPEKWVKEDEISPQVPDSPDSPAYVPEPSVNPFAVQEEVLPEISSEEDSDDDEYNENMKKLEQDINKDYLYSYHPETKQINYKELLTLSNITRNKKGQIIDPLHKTIPFLTRYDKAKILGLRAKQLNHGAKTLLPQLPRDIIDGHTIAYMELIQKKIPFIIRRPIPNGGSEYWKVNDLKNID